MSTKQRQILTIEESNLAAATKTEYGYRLKQFFKYCNITSCEHLIQIPNEELENILVDYCKFQISRVKSNELSPNTIPKMFKPIKFVLGINYRENDVRWRPIESLFPPQVKRSGFKAWTTQQIQEMFESCIGGNVSRNKALIHFMASIGGRIGIHEHVLQMKHLIPMSSTDSQNMDCYAVLLYADADERAEEKDYRDSTKDVVSGDSYWAFLTPEATKWLKRYHAERQRCGELFSNDTPIFRNVFSALRPKAKIRQLSKQAVFNIFERVLSHTSIKRTQKGRRYDTQLLHGFRKRFNTIMKLENNVNANIAEKIMGHKNGLDGVYFVPTRQQCFREFVKGIHQLTIDPNERQKIELIEKSNTISELEQERENTHQMKQQMAQLEQKWKDKITELEASDQRRKFLTEQADVESRKKISKIIQKSKSNISTEKIERILEILNS
jgi:hypothetical protein